MKTIRGKMLVRFGGVLTVLLIGFGGIIYQQMRNTLIPLTKRLSQEVLAARSDEMGRLMGGYLRDVQSIATRRTIRTGDRAAIVEELAESLQAYNGSDYEMFFYADASGQFLTTSGEEGNVADRVYFQAVVEQGASKFVSEPLVSRASGEHVFVVARPVANEQGTVVGMIGATVLLEKLSAIAADIQMGQDGFGYVVSGTGVLIAHPSREWRLKLNLLDSEAHGFTGLDAVGRRMLAGESGYQTYLRPDGSRFVALFHIIPHTPGWSLGLAISEQEIMGTAQALMRTLVLLMLGIVGAVLLVVMLVSNGMVSPILALCRGVQNVGGGHLDKRLDIQTGDEIEQLADAFNTMQSDLTRHIETLRKTTAEKERIECDLQVANRIQASMLPRIFPPFPNIDDLDLYATMEPAKEVGGDFYDFFLIDDHRMCFSIGDVSGKGVGAALFMVITRTILKNQALMGNPLSDIMRRTNDMLCAENEETMFVTIFMGILDIRTGDLEYVCAGHNPPLIARGSDPFVFLDVETCTIVGGIEDVDFPALRTTLAPGDLLLLYTDGVSEAMNAKDELFGDERMIEAANATQTRNAKSVIETIRSALDTYVCGTPASDDVTMLALGLTSSHNP